MNAFGEALKRKRIEARKTLREVSDRIGKSIGYLSDIEQGRKGVPELGVVEEIEKVIEVKDHFLLTLAATLRKKIDPEITERIKIRPQLSELLCRADNLSDSELESLIVEAQLIPERRRRQDSDA